MRRPYDDEDDDEDPWDAELDPDELVENPSSADIDTSVQQAYEDEFGDDEEETSLDDFDDGDADTDEFGDNEEGTPDEFGDNEEGTPDVDIPVVRTASLGRLRGRVRLPESEPETPEDAPEDTPETDEFGDMEEGGALTDLDGFGEEEPVQAAPPPRRRHARPPRHEHQIQDTPFADNDVSPEENDEPMYDNVGLGGFANKLVSLFSRGRK